MKFTKKMEKQMQYICDQIDERTALELLAEESAELSQAALKVIRARCTTLTNPCDKSQSEAVADLNLELVDVSLSAQVASRLVFGRSAEFGKENKKVEKTAEGAYADALKIKLDRWSKRLGYRDEPAAKRTKREARNG